DGAAGLDVLIGDYASETSGIALYDLTTGPTDLELFVVGQPASFIYGFEGVHFSSGSGTDILSGSTGDDILSAGANDDYVYGSAGSDTLDGGVGVDMLSYLLSTAGVHANIATGAVSGGYAEGDTISHFENLEGSAFADTLTGNVGDNYLN